MRGSSHKIKPGGDGKGLERGAFHGIIPGILRGCAPVVGETQTRDLVRRRESECFPICRKVDLIGCLDGERGCRRHEETRTEGFRSDSVVNMTKTSLQIKAASGRGVSPPSRHAEMKPVVLQTI